MSANTMGVCNGRFLSAPTKNFLDARMPNTRKQTGCVPLATLAPASLSPTSTDDMPVRHRRPHSTVVVFATLRVPFLSACLKTAMKMSRLRPKGRASGRRRCEQVEAAESPHNVAMPQAEQVRVQCQRSTCCVTICERSATSQVRHPVKQPRKLLKRTDRWSEHVHDLLFPEHDTSQRESMTS
ncbi:hypothetical protein BV20DRAFT_400730 [Pilatotrama ljubarskyi]|nr:hypothetical protein BV20DRAFT_400730 [Pilatotrama ljubarskyi]